jgi:peptidyl-prolyl cis-trans isomerase SurA
MKPKVEEQALEASLLRLDSIAKDIRNEKFSFDEAATFISQDKDTKNNNGLMANPNSGTARFEMQELAQVSQEVAKTVEGLNVGEISEPFTMINSKGKEICAIVKLKARIDGHKATIAEDYQRLKSIVQAKLGEEKIEKWIMEKQKSTYVRINENWVKCDFKYPGWVRK